MKTANPKTEIGYYSLGKWSVGGLPTTALLILLLATGEAKAHRSPANCNGIHLQMFLYAFHLDGSLANTVTNGEQIVYMVQAQNDFQLPSPTGTETSCDVTCAKFILQLPGTDGSPGPAIVLATNVNIPFGTPPFSLGVITSTVAVASGGSIARSIAQVSGVGHDLTIPGCAPDGTCETNECDPHLAFVQQSASVYVLRPAISISSSVSNVTNLQGNVTYVVSGTATNAGDEPVSNVVILSDETSGKMSIKTVASLNPGETVEFSDICTNSDTRCPSLSSKVTVTARGELTHTLLSSSATCPISLIPGLTLLPPKFRQDGGADLELICEPGWRYVIEASTDRVSWSSIGETLATSTSVFMTDSDAWKFSKRFYRARAICQ
jgi:hypothetical protein